MFIQLKNAEIRRSKQSTLFMFTAYLFHFCVSHVLAYQFSMKVNIKKKNGRNLLSLVSEKKKEITSYHIFWNYLHYFEKKGYKLTRGKHFYTDFSFRSFYILIHAHRSLPYDFPWLTIDLFYWTVCVCIPFYRENYLYALYLQIDGIQNEK